MKKKLSNNEINFISGGTSYQKDKRNDNVKNNEKINKNYDIPSAWVRFMSEWDKSQS